MFRYRLSDAAQADVIDILAWPDRPGSIERPELGAGVRSWHQRLSRDHVGTGAEVVRKPRHFLIYRVEPALLVVGRVLHDAMELARHLEPETSWE